MAKNQKVKDAPKEKVKGDSKLLTAYPAEVIERLERQSGKQAVYMVRCKVLDGRDAGKIMRRLVYGPTRPGDIIMLTQTEIEAGGSRGGRR
tara:strand:- start:557 stop:829 length:273 start_codon:yes stop_codon:yes gene_type:complete